MSFLSSASGGQPRIDQFRINRALYGAVIPLLYGTHRLTPNFIWAGDFAAHQDKPGKFSLGGKGAPGFYTYTMSVQGALCDGVIADIGRSWAFGGGPGISYATFTRAQTLGYAPGDIIGWTPFDGSYGQLPWTWLSTLHPEAAFGYTGVAHLDYPNWPLGGSATPPQVAFEVSGRQTRTPFGNTGGRFLQPAPFMGLYDCVPSMVITDFLTDSRVGLGLPGTWIGVDRPQVLTFVEGPGYSPSFAEYALYTRAQSLWLSILMDTQRPASDWIDEILQITNSEMICSNEALIIVPYCNGRVQAPLPSWTEGAGFAVPTSPIYDPNGYVFTGGTGNPNTAALTSRADFTDEDYIAPEGQAPVMMKRTMPQDIYNSVRVNFSDRGADYRNNHFDPQVQDLISTLGLKPTPSYDWTKFICLPQVAITAATLRLRRLAFLGNEYTFTVAQQFIYLDPMDVVTITDSVLGLNAQKVWVQNIEEDENYNLTLHCIDIFPATTAQYGVQLGVGGSGVNANSPAGSANPPILIEPYSSMTNGQYQLWFAVSGQGSWGGGNILVSLDGGLHYNQLGSVSGQNPQGRLATTLPSHADPDSVNTPNVNTAISGAGLPSVTNTVADMLGNLAVVDTEVISYATATLQPDGTWQLSYIRRGVYDSAIATHAAGVPFAFLGSLTSQLAPGIFIWTYPKSLIGTTIKIKIQGFNTNGQKQQDPSTLPVYNYTLAGFGHTGSFTPAGAFGPGNLFNEVPAGGPTNFTLSQPTPVPGSVLLKRNGIEQVLGGAGADGYTLVGNAITLNAPLGGGDALSATYWTPP